MKVFISYHRADTKYKNNITNFLKEENIDFYVVRENYNFDGKYHQDIAQKIIKKMNDCDVTICIIGKETYSRPHIDHELKATLKGSRSQRRGLVGVMLETREDNINSIDRNTFPKRILDNYQESNKYCVLIQYASFRNQLRNALDKANKNRKSAYNINNSAQCMKLRRTRYYDN